MVPGAACFGRLPHLWTSGSSGSYRSKYRNQEGGFFKQEFVDLDEDADDDVKIIRTKRFGIKPMFPEDACVQMELLGHNFFVFMNAETDEVNVVYKRKNNTYGLIEPEFD